MQIEKPIEPDHPVLRVPTHEEAAAILAEHGAGKLAELMSLRNAAIRAERENPLENGFELPTWLLADVLLGFIGYDVFKMRIQKLIAMAWAEDIAISLQEWLEDERLERAIRNGPYQLGLLLGGNSAAKTEYMIKRMVEHAVKFDGAEIWAFHQAETPSIDYHQTRTWKFLPAHWKNAGMKGRPAYVAYKTATGFPKGGLIGPNSSKIKHKNYAQDEDDAIEGGEVGDVLTRRCVGWVADELLPESWLRTLEKRLNRRQAVGIVGFTPKWGYTETVARFLDGAQMVREEWGDVLATPKMIPLVRVNENKVIINFHTRYNPYPNRGSYPNLVAMVQGDNDNERAIRVYGHTEAERITLFGKLSEKAHSFASIIFED